jgi:hypothetical protein
MENYTLQIQSYQTLNNKEPFLKMEFRRSGRMLRMQETGNYLGICGGGGRELLEDKHLQVQAADEI